MFTPGDISDLLVNLAADEIRANLGHGITATPREAAAAILNAAIEAGVVSPPCHCLRWDGELQMQEFTDVPKVFAGRPWSKDGEHYRGQTR